MLRVDEVVIHLGKNPENVYVIPDDHIRKYTVNITINRMSRLYLYI